jgi:tripartite-type tricarboxylate transporter receptor subunit TctC
MAEEGVSGYDYASFLGYYAPKGTPTSALQRLNQAFVKAIASKEAQEFFAQMGMIGLSSTPEQLRTFNQQQIENWGRLVRIAKLEPQ